MVNFTNDLRCVFLHDRDNWPKRNDKSYKTTHTAAALNR